MLSSVRCWEGKWLRGTAQEAASAAEFAAGRCSRDPTYCLLAADAYWTGYGLPQDQSRARQVYAELCNRSSRRACYRQQRPESALLVMPASYLRSDAVIARADALIASGRADEAERMLVLLATGSESNPERTSAQERLAALAERRWSEEVAPRVAEHPVDAVRAAAQLVALGGHGPPGGALRARYAELRTSVAARLRAKQQSGLAGALAEDLARHVEGRAPGVLATERARAKFPAPVVVQGPGCEWLAQGLAWGAVPARPPTTTIDAHCERSVDEKRREEPYSTMETYQKQETRSVSVPYESSCGGGYDPCASRTGPGMTCVAGTRPATPCTRYRTETRTVPVTGTRPVQGTRTVTRRELRLTVSGTLLEEGRPPRPVSVTKLGVDESWTTPHDSKPSRNLESSVRDDAVNALAAEVRSVQLETMLGRAADLASSSPEEASELYLRAAMHGADDPTMWAWLAKRHDLSKETLGALLAARLSPTR